MNDVIDALSAHQLADALQVAVAASEEEHLLDDVVLVAGYVDELRAGTGGFVLNVSCSHWF